MGFLSSDFDLTLEEAEKAVDVNKRAATMTEGFILVLAIHELGIWVKLTVKSM